MKKITWKIFIKTNKKKNAKKKKRFRFD